MTQLVDINKGLYISKSNKNKFMLIFILSTVLVVFLVSLLMITSKDNYTVNLIFTIIFTVIYLFYSVFYFSVLKRKYDDEYRFYLGANSCEKTYQIITLGNFEEKTKIYNGLEYYVINATTKENRKDIDKYFLCQNKNIGFKKGSKVKIATYGIVILEIEKYDERQR